MSQKTLVNQKELELEISNLLNYGDLMNISHESGIEYNYLKSQLNPNDIRMSYIVGALLICLALRKINADKGARVWQIMCREWEKTTPVELEFCSSHETGMLSKEVSEFVAAKLDGLPFNKQMDEFLHIEKQIERTKQALIHEHNCQNSQLPNVRSMKVKNG